MHGKIFMPVKQTIPRFIPNTYNKVFSDSRHKVLQWVMDKMWNFLVEKEYIKQVMILEHEKDARVLELDLDRLDEQICRCDNAVLEIYNQKADTIILGGNVMDKIHKNLRDVGQFNYHMNGESNYGYIGLHTDIGPKRTMLVYRGFNVIMVPWFEGFLLCNMEDR
jgi:hypothetical protein